MNTKFLFNIKLNNNQKITKIFYQVFYWKLVDFVLFDLLIIMYIINYLLFKFISQNHIYLIFNEKFNFSSKFIFK